MEEYGGKYRASLRLVMVDRLEEEPEKTEDFYFEEDEEIIDVAWFSGSVSVTLVKVEWSKNFNKPVEQVEPCGPNCIVTPETARCHPVSWCVNCKGRGTVSEPYTHPTNPVLDTWISVVCNTCGGKGA